MSSADITISIVSHGQNTMVNNLLADIGRICSDPVRIIVTENIPDRIPIETARLSQPVAVIANSKIKGFGANHNAAFARCQTAYFCVCNPDIRLPVNPFPPLFETLGDANIGATGPLVLSPSGSVEDSARRFPTLKSLAKKACFRRNTPDYPSDQGPLRVDWCAGMFLLFRSEAFRTVGGFDEGYFLYYEDVDICARLKRGGHDIIYNPNAIAIHSAQRESRKNLRLALYHLSSLARFLGNKPT